MRTIHIKKNAPSASIAKAPPPPIPFDSPGTPSVSFVLSASGTVTNTRTIPSAVPTTWAVVMSNILDTWKKNLESFEACPAIVKASVIAGFKYPISRA